MIIYYAALVLLALVIGTYAVRVITRVHHIRHESLLSEDYLDTVLDVLTGQK
jgi:hypothetical protein